MKLLSALLLSLLFTCSLQYPQNHVQELKMRDERMFDLTSALVAVVDQLIETVSNALNNLITKAGQLVLSGIASIEEAINNAILNFMVQLDEARRELEELLTGQIAECFTNLNGDFETTKNDTIDAVVTCYNNGKDGLLSISTDLSDYGTNNQIIIETLKNKIQSCLLEANFLDKAKCAVDAVGVIRDTIENLMKNIEGTAKNITSKIETSVEGSYLCIQQELENGQQEIEGILEGVKDCIASASTTEAQEETTTTTEEIATEPEENTTEPEENTTEPEENTTEPEENTTEPEENTTEPEENTTEPEENTTEPEENTTEPEENTTEPEENTTEPEENTTEPEENTTEPEENTTDPQENTE